MNGLTVKELHAKLGEMIESGHGEHIAAFQYNYGDYWKTQVAVGISEVDEGFVSENARVDMEQVLDEDQVQAARATIAYESIEFVERDEETGETGLVDSSNKPILQVVLLS